MLISEFFEIKQFSFSVLGDNLFLVFNQPDAYVVQSPLSVSLSSLFIRAVLSAY